MTAVEPGRDPHDAPNDVPGRYLGLPHGRLALLLQPVTPANERTATPSVDWIESSFARAALTTVVESGDTDAGALVRALGPARILRILVEGDDAAALLDRVESAAGTARARKRVREALARWRSKLSLPVAIRSLENAAHVGAGLLTPEQACWPPGLADLGAGQPVALWARGDTSRVASLHRSVALVGARAATGYGEHVAMESAAGLADRGFAIVSGGAYGIDGAAHRATVASDQVTIAFLAGGVDRLYPAGHSDLLRRVAETGLLLGELPCGSAPTRWRFLMRNRLIAAASSATVVVEAGRRSGSLNTAGHAAEIGRPLGAVPGPVTSPASAGCHRLIREYGATCVTTVDEMAELADPLGATNAEHETGSDGQIASDRRVLGVLGRRPAVTVDALAHHAQLSVPEVVAALGRLESAGAVHESGRGWEAR